MSRAFSTTSTYVRHTGTPASAAPLTLSCWFNVSDVTTTHTLMCITDAGAEIDYFRLVANGAVAGDPVRAEARRSSSGTADTSTSYTANVWHHACGVFTASNSRTAYLNGGGAVTNTTSAAPSGLDRSTVGMLDRLSAANPTVGSIAEAAIWNVALDASEVASLAAGVSPLKVRPASLVYCAPLVRNVQEIHGLALTDASSQSSIDHPRIYR